MASKVVLIRGKGVLTGGGDIDQKKLLSMYNRGIQILMDNQNPKDSLRLIFKNSDRLGIKINTIAGRKLSSRPEVSYSLASLLQDGGIQPKNIIIWDRTNRELREAGYRLNLNRGGIKVIGTDTKGFGYDSQLTSYLNIGSLFSSIQSNKITASISLAILKDHGMAGVTAGMKNYFGAVHNPNKYHDFNCNPFVAELFETKFIKQKHKLSILDSLIVQYHRGPSYHARWAEKYEALIFSLDPVAADYVGWQVIEKLRAKKGLASLKEEKRAPVYLKTAEKMGLGKASPEEIKIIEEDV
ncbi:MAG: DUF362 domain-containing protein [Candidatus Aminicenantes bacterium]|nr:DUF362 domain-containing protein [Candidatus Aminicenantes bacterium]